MALADKKCKLPAFQFYTGDWLKDPKLSMCSPATRGIWIDALCAMHESDRSGSLTGTPDQLARVLRCTPSDVHSAVSELRSSGAADIRENGEYVTLINRRMAKEHKLRSDNQIRQQRYRRYASVTGKSPPTSSSSSSKEKTYIPEISVPVAVAPLPKNGNSPPKRKILFPVPEEFPLTDSMLSWAKLNASGIDLEGETEKFLDHFRGKGERRADWVASWRNWMRNAASGMFAQRISAPDDTDAHNRRVAAQYLAKKKRGS